MLVNSLKPGNGFSILVAVKQTSMRLPRIENPCPADWNKMSPEANGRFCAQCRKVVVDFTKKTTEDILEYLRKHSGEGICGRVRPSQIQAVPVASGQKLQFRLKRFYLALYLVFGGLLFTTASCGGNMAEPSPEQMHKLDSAVRADSIKAAQNADSIHKADSLKQDSAGKQH